jgi:hypothetical protein
VATYVYSSSQGQRTHSVRTKIPNMVVTYAYASSQGQRTHSAQTNFLKWQELRSKMYQKMLPTVYIWLSTIFFGYQ